VRVDAARRGNFVRQIASLQLMKVAGIFYFTSNRLKRLVFHESPVSNQILTLVKEQFAFHPHKCDSNTRRGKIAGYEVGENGKYDRHENEYSGVLGQKCE
jgi:hypothetical protein